LNLIRRLDFLITFINNLKFYIMSATFDEILNLDNMIHAERTRLIVNTIKQNINSMDSNYTKTDFNQKS
jgi:hypothetical protein